MFQRAVFGLGLVLVVAFAIGTFLTTDHAVARADTIVKVAVDSGGDAHPAPAVKGSDKKGKYYFKKTCKGCHGQDGEGGELTPMSKTIKQWERVFRKDKHVEGETFSTKFDDTQLLHIRTFLINHAADSDQPETCG